MKIDDAQLAQLLAELDFLPKADLARAQSIAAEQKVSLYDTLVALDLISDDNLGRLIASTYNIPYIPLSEVSPKEDIFRLTPEKTAKKYHTITFDVENNDLKIATSEPGRKDLFAALAKKAGLSGYKLYYATDHGLAEAFRLYKKDLQTAFNELLATKGELPITQIIDTLIEYGYSSKASDIHIEPSTAETVVRFRIDGVLHDVIELPKAIHNQIITKIKVMSRLPTDDHMSALDGKTKAEVEGDSLDIRVSIIPLTSGEKAVMRLLSERNRQFGLSDLGMNETDLEKVRNAFKKPYGMILPTGPTGAGKTTTMYAILKIINTREKNISTIEDPVEYAIDGINQIQVNAKANLTFASGLRSILRQDPDSIYIGEIRDEETAGIAINSALTGHLVMSTMHTNNAATALPRFIDMNIEPFLIASTINVIIGQRLVRKICGSCKVSVELTRTKTGWSGKDVTESQLAALSTPVLKEYFANKNTIRLYHGKGCSVCHSTGYQGRIGVFEVLEISPKIQRLIIERADSAAIMKQAVSEGMTTMQMDGLNKFAQGITTIEEVLRVTQ